MVDENRGGAKKGGGGVKADLRVRAGARLIDLVVAVALGAGLARAFGATFRVEWSTALALSPALMALAAWVACDVVGTVFGGATLGKAVLGLRVKTASLGPCSWPEAAVRALLFPVDALRAPMLFMLRGAENVGPLLGDRYAKTVVVRVSGADAAAEEARRATRLGVAFSLVAFLAVGSASADLLARSEETLSCDRQDPANRDTCLAKLAVAAKKPSLCERSDSSHGRDDCYAHAGRDLGPSMCEKVDAHDVRERCYMLSAREASTCDKVEDAQLHGQCVTRVASATHDPKLCESLTVMRDACIAALGPGGGKKDDVCAAYTASAARDACYLQHGMCEHIESPAARDQCLLGSDHTGANCDKIEAPQAKAACVAAAAATQNDPSLCDLVGTSPSNRARRQCYAGAFAHNATPGLCARFADSVTVQDCFTAAAKNAHDASLCAKVTDPARNKVCVQQAKP